MKINYIVYSLLAFFSISALSQVPPPIPAAMSPLVMESKAEFTDVVIFRYTAFDTESHFPCMRFETIDPISNEILATNNYCEITLPFGDNQIIDTRTKAQSVEYSDLKFSDNTFTFKVHLVTTIPGAPSFSLLCSLTLDSDIMSEVSCKF
jgi:hypothetical protein